MLYRRFGRTELQMPVFSCGGMRYQHAWQDKPLAEVPDDNQRNLEATVERAIALGITHIETARFYGSSERQLGPVLRRFDRDGLIIQTKIAPTEDPAEFRANVEDSLARLQVDYVDLLGLHGLNDAQTFDWALRPGGCLDAAEDLRRQGRVRHIGFSTHAPREQIEAAIATGRFDYVNLHWYWIFQDNWPAIEAASRQDMGVFIISPSDKGGHLYNPSQRLSDLCTPLHPMVFNDLFCLSHSQVHTLSIGAARPTDFDRHLETLPLLAQADDLLPPIQQRLRQAAVEVLGEDWLRRWSVGLPRWDQTPGEVNIPVMVWLWNLLQAYDLQSFARARYNLLGNGGHWFPGQRLGDRDPTEFRDCLQRSPFAERIPAILADLEARIGGESVQRLSQSS